MDYTDAIRWLHSLGRVTDEPGPGRMAPLLAALGNPQRRLRFVHVVGTNGKGSAAAMVSGILCKAGYKTGTNISPYVLEFSERFQINGQNVAEQDIAAAFTKVREAMGQLNYPVIEFMVVTAAAFVLFADAGCDIAVLEAGVGGVHDDTNIIEDTLAVCMMRVGLDHTELLGDTIEEIALDKSGVFKNYCDVICYPGQPLGAMEVIRQQAEKAGSALIVPDVNDIHFYHSRPFENRINYGGYDLVVPFAGAHQALNAAVAVETALSLWRKGFVIEDAHIIEGIAAAHLPARIQVYSREPLILLDGAHNEDSAMALAGTLRAEDMRRLTAVIGVLQDKNAQDMLDILSPYINTIYTVTPDSPRALPAQQLAQVAAEYCQNVEACQTVGEAIDKARHNPGKGILVCGSFYLVKEALESLEQ